MTGTDAADDGRLGGRRPRAPRREEAAADQDGRGDEAPEDEEIDTVNRIMGFLRGDPREGPGEGAGPA
jgi:hypothetical protein